MIAGCNLHSDFCSNSGIFTELDIKKECRVRQARFFLKIVEKKMEIHGYKLTFSGYVFLVCRFVKGTGILLNIIRNLINLN